MVSVHLSVLARHHSLLFAQPELLVALLVVQVLESLPLFMETSGEVEQEDEVSSPQADQ